MIDATYLTEALAALGSHKRRHLKVAACERRDLCALAGEHDVALVFNALAATVADIDDDERRTMAAVERDFSIVLPLTADELEEPPC